MFRMLLISLLAVTVATAPASASESPLEVPGAVTVDAETATSLWDQGVLFIDVRKDSDWDAGRIPGAIHLELKLVFSETALRAVADAAEPLVIYCNGPKCPRSSEASALAANWGFASVHYFRGGFPAWEAADYPIE